MTLSGCERAFRIGTQKMIPFVCFLYCCEKFTFSAKNLILHQMRETSLRSNGESQMLMPYIVL